MKFSKILSDLYLVLKFFCSKTSLHGFMLIGDPFLTHLERVVWSIIMCIQFYCCYFYTKSALSYSNETFIALDSKLTPAFEVKYYYRWNDGVFINFSCFQFPLPVLLLCGNQYSLDVVDPTKPDEIVFSAIKNISMTLNTTETNVLNALAILYPKNDVFTRNAHENVSIDFYRIAKFMDEKISNDGYFQPVFTEIGMCSSYKSINFSEIFREK